MRKFKDISFIAKLSVLKKYELLEELMNQHKYESEDVENEYEHE